MRRTSTTASRILAAFILFVNVFLGSGAVFTGRPVFLRWARVEEAAALFANSTPNTEIFHEPIQKAAESALVVRCVLIISATGVNKVLSRMILIAVSRLGPKGRNDGIADCRMCYDINIL